MKVLCIKNGLWRGDVTGRIKKNPKYGDVCTVEIETEINYKLVEWPDPVGYHKSRFIPISDIDETEFVREKVKEHS